MASAIETDGSGNEAGNEERAIAMQRVRGIHNMLRKGLSEALQLPAQIKSTAW